MADHCATVGYFSLLNGVVLCCVAKGRVPAWVGALK
jgi:hypothetical protein